MSFEKEVLVRARARYAEQVDRHHEMLRQRQELLYQEYPRLKEIDHTLQETSAAIMAETFRKGRDPREGIQALHRENTALQNERRRILTAAGYASGYLGDGPMCRRCSDTGYIGSQMCSCLEKLCMEEQRRTLTSLLSTRSSSFDDFSLDYYPDTIDASMGASPRQMMEIVYETCVQYARRFSLHSRSLLMSGGTGLGKTFLSACIAQQVVQKGYSVVYDTAIRIFSALEHQKFGGATEEDQRLAERIMACDLLILDDLGTEMNTSFISPALYSIVNGRILAERPTIISTNLSMGELAGRYTPQIASRLMGEYVFLGFKGQDIRQLRPRD